MSLLRRGVGARLAVGLVDSAVASAGNLGVSVIAAKSTSLRDFGVFATAMLVLILVTLASRGAHGDALILNARSSDPRSVSADARHSTTSVIRLSSGLGLVACLTGAAIVVAGPRGSESLAFVLVVSGTALPLLCLQDHVRWIEYARGAGHRALINNAMWTGLSIVGLLAVRFVSGERVPAFVCLAVWAFSTVPGIIYALVRGRIPLVIAVRHRWIRDNRSLVTHLFSDLVLTQATAQGATLIIAALSGSLEMALIRKGQIWLGPVTVITMGLLSALQPVLAQRAATRGNAEAVRLAVLAGSAVSLTILVYGLMVLALPTHVAQFLVGPGWEETRPYILPLVIQGVGGMIGGCLGLALRTTGLIGRQVRWRMVLAPASVAVVAVGTTLNGALAGMWWLAAASALTAAAWAVLLRVGHGRPAKTSETGSSSPRLTTEALQRHDSGSGEQVEPRG